MFLMAKQKLNNLVLSVRKMAVEKFIYSYNN
jgi:hypothetical protein